jgi:hypothetical protein
MGSVQVVGASTASVGIFSKQVKVEQVNPTTGIALCRDEFNQETQVPMSVRRNLASWPREGEHWIIAKSIMGGWTFEAILSAVPPPEVTGSRAAADPVTLSLLAALVSQGIVLDGTTA